MSDLLSGDKQAMIIVSRFGIPMGVGERTIDEVCKEYGIHTPTLLAVVNNHCAECGDRRYNAPVGSGKYPRIAEEDIDINTLMLYLKNAHTYYLEFQLPRLRRQLIEAINPTDTNNQIPLLILRYFDDYVQEIRIHIEHEDEGQMEEHAVDDQHIAKKLHELMNLIIKYFPSNSGYPFANEQLTSVLTGLYQIEEELQIHCAIEDDILRPALARKATRNQKSEVRSQKRQEELSEREKDVLKLVVQGLINKEIADKLHLSLHTVVTHRKNIAKKLDIHSTAGLTIYAIVNHLVDVETAMLNA